MAIYILINLIDFPRLGSTNRLRRKSTTATHLYNGSSKHDTEEMIMYRIKPEDLYILSFENGRGRRLRPFSKLRM